MKALIIILLLHCTISFSQNTDYTTRVSEVNFTNQLSDKIFVSMKYRNYSWGMGQQFYKITLKNNTSSNLKVELEYFANLTCGNKSVTKVTVNLKPYESLNEGSISYLSDNTGLVASADESECKGVSVTDPNGVKRINRISSLGYRFLKIENVDETKLKEEQTKEQQEKDRVAKEQNQLNAQKQKENAQKENDRITEQNRVNEEKIRLEKQRIDAANRQINADMNSINNEIASIGDYLIQNMFRKAIERENQYRQEEFKELKEKVSNGEGTTEDCSSCDGQGHETCYKCNGEGSKMCYYCAGQGSQKCTYCYGSGQKNGSACVICGGNGSKDCITCKNNGKTYCTDCHATGQKFCVNCQGTGKKFKYK